MNVHFDLIAERFCLTLLHSVWQMALLLCIVLLVERLFRQISPEKAYAISLVALLTGLCLLPITLIGATSLMSLHAPMAEVSIAPEIGWAAPTHSVAPSPHVEASSTKTAQSAATMATASAPAQKLHTAWQRAVPWIVTLYGCGVFAMSLRLGRSAYHASSLRRSAAPISGGAITEMVTALSSRMALRIVPLVAYSERVLVPTVVGLTKPTLLLPASVMTGLTTEQVEMVLAHELTHIRRADMWVTVVQRLAECMLFFNPFVWYLSRRISVLREHCCDESVCTATDAGAADERLRYAGALLRLVELSGVADARVNSAVQLAATGDRPSELRFRIARLLGSPRGVPTANARVGVAMTLAALALCCISLGLWPQRLNASEARKIAPNAREFSAGGAVELVAIGKRIGGKDTWWDTSGQVMDVPFKWQRGHTMNGKSDPWHRVVIRLVDLPEGSESTWRIMGASRTGGAGVTIDGNRRPEGYLARHFEPRDGSESLDIRVGLGSGDWDKIGQTGATGGGAMGRNEHSVLFSPAFDTDQGVVIVVSHNYFETNFRIVAIDKQGKLHDQSGRGGSSANGIYQAQGRFPGLSLDQIERIEFQIRTYEWVEFKDIPRAPGDQDKISEVEMPPKPEVGLADSEGVNSPLPGLFSPDQTLHVSSINEWAEDESSETPKPWGHASGHPQQLEHQMWKRVTANLVEARDAGFTQADDWIHYQVGENPVAMMGKLRNNPASIVPMDFTEFTNR